MKKFYFYPILAVCMFSAAAVCTNNRPISPTIAQKSAFSLPNRSSIDVNEKIVLRVKNMEDYIYMTDDDQDIFFKQFEAYADEVGYPNVEVVYSTTDTNETLYTQLLTGKSSYDLICPSEYMIQKMIHEGLLVKLNKRHTLLPNYDEFASAYIRNRFDSIETTDEDGNTVTLGEYGVGYMWGTLGILFNPFYSDFDPSKAVYDATSWDMLWNVDYNGTISIKDSMRDTYAMAVMQFYQTELEEYRDQYEASEITAEQYNAHVSEILNRSDDQTIKDVEGILETLRGNIFGLEVDSGKSDIVSGKIGINLAWSGDAVYSMDLGDEEGKTLTYSIPELGSNLWFDAWVMPNTPRSELQEEVAYLFLDFLSIPEYARENMEYTGYTSFIGGEDIRDLVRDWYDVRTDEIYYPVDEDEEIYASIYRLNPLDGSDYEALSYEDFLSDEHDSAFDEHLLVYFDEDEEGEIIDDTNPYYVKLLDEDGEETEVNKTYGDLTIVDDPDSELEDVNLNYFFNNEYVDDLDSDLPEYHFYSDEYFFTVEDNEGNLYSNTSVGRQFFCQYPDLDAINRCAVMKDFGPEANAAVLAMWERFKTTSLPTWALIIFVTEIAVTVGLITYFAVNKKLKYTLRKKRKQDNLNN